MRGEKESPTSAMPRQLGSPPHARGKVKKPIRNKRIAGITPACAGKREASHAHGNAHRDHPRMRGEKKMFPADPTSYTGSPPHARGKGPGRHAGRAAGGITPACAGKSAPITKSPHHAGDHPRMRGEKHIQHRGGQVVVGSPPHARGKGLNTSIICCILAQNTYLHRNFV